MVVCRFLGGVITRPYDGNGWLYRDPNKHGSYASVSSPLEKVPFDGHRPAAARRGLRDETGVSHLAFGALPLPKHDQNLLQVLLKG
jgi:hypothetical protein